MQTLRSPVRVRDVMIRNVECAHLHEPIQIAAERMRERDVNALPVLDGDEMVGMITAKDIVHRAVSLGHDPREVKVHEVLTRNVVTCRQDHTLNEAAAIMEGAHVRYLPVLDDDVALVGMLSLEDLAKFDLDLKTSGRVLKSTVPDRGERVPAHAPKTYSTKPKLKD